MPNYQRKKNNKLDICLDTSSRMTFYFTYFPQDVII